MREIVLASASKRRSEILNSCGIKHSVIISDINEIIDNNIPVSKLVILNSEAKAKDVALDLAGPIIISADTLVSHGKDIIGKPKDENEAKSILSNFSGNFIDVYTGITVYDTMFKKMLSDFDKSAILVSKINNKEMEKFFKLLGPYDKAGGFSIEGVGSMLFDNIKGSYFNILGLSMIKVKELFAGLGLDITDFINSR